MNSKTTATLFFSPCDRHSDDKRDICHSKNETKRRRAIAATYARFHQIVRIFVSSLRAYAQWSSLSVELKLKKIGGSAIPAAQTLISRVRCVVYKMECDYISYHTLMWVSYTMRQCGNRTTITVDVACMRMR